MRIICTFYELFYSRKVELKCFLNDPHLLTDLLEGFQGFVEMFLFVSGGNLHADAGLAFWHNRIVETYYVNSFLKQFCCKFLRKRGIIQHHRANS